MKPTSAHINTLGKVKFPTKENLETNHKFVILLIKKNFSVEHTGGHAEVADLFEYNRGSPQVKKAFFSENLVDEDM